MRSPVSILGLLACASLGASSAAAQSFSYPDFSSVAGIAFNGDAAQAGNVLRITPAAATQIGSAFYGFPVSVETGFTTTFTFQFSQLANGGADGMAFVLHGDNAGTTALGATGTAMGYGAYTNSPVDTAIANSLVVELDTWLSGGQQPPSNDTSANEISVHTNGPNDNSYEESVSIGRVTPAIDMSDQTVHTLRIVFVPGTLEVFLDNLVTPVLSMAYSITNGGTWLAGGNVEGLTLTGGLALVGFSAGSGGAHEHHDVLSWSFDSSSLGTDYCSPAINNSTGFPAILSSSGSPIIANNNVNFIVDQLPLNRFGYFVMGENQGFISVGQGFLCISLPFVRFNTDILDSGNAGQMTFSPNLTSLPAGTVFVTGDTWNFQCWYRDVNPGNTSNLSNGIEITFQ